MIMIALISQDNRSARFHCLGKAGTFNSAGQDRSRSKRT
jgi:hypothetical protein